jgi:hypothetical protein
MSITKIRAYSSQQVKTSCFADKVWMQKKLIEY